MSEVSLLLNKIKLSHDKAVSLISMSCSFSEVPLKYSHGGHLGHGQSAVCRWLQVSSAKGSSHSRGGYNGSMGGSVLVKQGGRAGWPEDQRSMTQEVSDAQYPLARQSFRYDTGLHKKTMENHGKFI